MRGSTRRPRRPSEGDGSDVPSGRSERRHVTAAGAPTSSPCQGDGELRTTALVGLFVAARFVEDTFVPAPGRRWSASIAIFRRGVALARRDREILLVLAATLLINGASQVAWLFPKKLLNVGFPNDPVLWYTGLIVLSFLVGAIALRMVEQRINGIGVARRTYAFNCFIAAIGLLVLTYAADALVGSVGVVLAYGIAFNVTRAVRVVWVEQARHE